MAEVGLVLFARTALEVMQEVLPAYSHKYSKHTFTQPQLMTVLCLMRFEDWTFREAEVRLAEHSDLRRALGLERVPDHTTLYRFMRRVTDETLDEVLIAVASRLVPRRRGRKPKKAVVAVDATGLAPGSVSTYFVNRRTDRGEGLEWRHWCKWTVVVDVLRRCVLAQAARQGPYNDCATLRPLVSAAHEVMPVGLVLADAEFDSERNHRHVREVIGADSVIPAKRGKADWKITGVRAQMRRRFPSRRYSQRAQVESVFSAVKRKLSAKAPGRSSETQRRQAMLLGVAYNIYLL
jgi:IS5 family transposase